ncbi:MAG: nicotinate-nucleotide adenylyltransferase [Defluviitaleaceae bacterium]|nr:nicotinate-nucleotide adenylyltransferase [Defluviitaleaceae bacterium]
MASKHDYLERCESLAVLGGTFDPVHIGHLALAEEVLQQFRPQRLLFIPSANPPHKQGRPKTHSEHRFKMVLAATCENPAFDCSRLELERPGESYTIDTIKQLRKICPAGAKIYFITGADAMLDILSWKNAEELLTLCSFITVRRPGAASQKLETHVAALRENFKAEIYLMDMPLYSISGTEIREKLARGESVRGMMPIAAETYARQHGLYQTVQPDLGPEHFEWAKARLKQQLSPRRFKHTLGTCQEAEALARHYGGDVLKARWAALLHDATKEYSAEKKLTLCRKWGITLDPVLEANIDITHCMLSEESARRDFFVEDSEILQAIRYHTTGWRELSLLDRIIMLADYIEPHREDYPGLEQMRELAYKDMDAALVVGIKATIEEEDLIHPWSYDALRLLAGEGRG